MPNFAVLKSNYVDNIIVADSLESAILISNENCVEYTDDNPAAIGFLWDGKVFSNPAVAIVEEAPEES
jgi:hypothetical protein